MREVRHNGHKLVIYDSIQELPVSRFILFSVNLMIDAGIGGDAESIGTRINLLRELLLKGDMTKAHMELNNLQQCMLSAIQKINPKMNAFCVMLKSMDGEEIKDDELNEVGISKIIERLGKKGFRFNLINRLVNEIKKKIDVEMKLFFPAMDMGEGKEYYGLLKRRTIEVLKGVINNEDREQEIKRIDENLFGLIKIKNYFGSDGLEIKVLNGFEKIGILLNQNNIVDKFSEMSVLKYYNALEIVEKQVKNGKN